MSAAIAWRPGLRFDDDAGHPRAVQHRRDDPTVQPQLDALFPEQVQRGDLGRLGIEADGVGDVALADVVL